MPRFDELVGQQRPVRVLAGILAKREIPHAFLFTGIDGVGKRTAAMLFAMALNCLTHAEGGGPVHEPCGECRSCRAVISGAHPFVTLVEPVGGVIKIDRIREIVRRISFRPPGAGTRVIIIADAHRMNPEAANALLKSLEEPPPQTIFFLTAENVSDLLPTVVSRCSHVRFNPVPPEAVETFIRDRYQLDKENARLVAAMSEGSIAKALDIAGTPGELDRLARMRRRLCEELYAMPSHRLSAVLAFAERMYKNKDHIDRWLYMILSFLKDAMVVCAGGGKNIANTDVWETVLNIARRESVQSLAAKIDAVLETERAILRNLNLRLSLELMALRLADRCDEKNS